MNYCYVRPTDYFTANTQTKAQIAACEALAKLNGITIDPSEGGGGYLTAQSTSDTHVRDGLVKRLGPNDTLLIASPDVLADKPSELIAAASKVVASGCRLLVASLAGEVNLGLLRAYVAPFTALETQIADLNTKAKKQAADFDAELEAFMKSYDAKILSALSQRGITISQLAGAGNVKEDIGSPSKAKELRELRQSLGLNQEQAAALVTAYLGQPAPGKPAVSKAESQGCGTNFDALLTALKAEEYTRNRAAKAAMQAAPDFDYQTLHQAGLPTPNEEATAQAQGVNP